MKSSNLLALALLIISWVGCTHKVQIEPSEKPFVVNLNVKIDHEIRHKIEKQNEDLLSLEDEAISKPSDKKSKAGKGGKKS